MLYSAPGVFNVLDSTFAGGMIPGSTGTNTGNAGALQAAINAAQASGSACGAIVLIPSADQIAGQFGAYKIGATPWSSPIISIPAPAYANAPLLICGTGSGTELSMQTAEAPSGETTVLFSVADTTNVTFQDLHISFDKTGENSQTGVAFSFSGGAGHKLFRVNVENCQYPVMIDGSSGIAIAHCEFNYGDFASGSIPNATALQIFGGANHTSIASSLISYNAKDTTYESSYVGISIAESSFTKVRDTQCTGFGYGVIVGDGAETAPAVGTTFAAVRISGTAPQSGPAITINPSVFDISFADCHCEVPSTYNGTGVGIQIGQSGDINAYLDTIRFTSCTLVGAYGITGGAYGSYGLQINAGQNIQIVGGKYSGCGTTAGITVAGPATEVQIIGATCIGPELGFEDSTNPGPLYQAYGIAILAGQDIQILNANCSGSGTPTQPGTGLYLSPASGQTIVNVKIIGAICMNPVLEVTAAQQYGLYANDVSELLVQGCAFGGSSSNGIFLENVTQATIAACDLRGNQQGIYVGSGCSSVYLRGNTVTGYTSLNTAVSFASSLTNIEVTDCAGYNDQQVVLFGPAPPPSGVFSAISLHGYYGPSTFYLSGGGRSVQIDAGATGLTSGVFILGPGQYAQVTGIGAPGVLFMIGS